MQVCKMLKSKIVIEYLKYHYGVAMIISRYYFYLQNEEYYN